MGESELVLDTLSVDEVLKLIGGRSSGQERAESSAPTHAPSASNSPNSPNSPDAPNRVRESASADAALGSGDWREALRATGASPNEMPKKKVGRYEFPAGETTTPASNPVDPAAIERSPSANDSATPTGGSPHTPAFKSPFADVRAGISVGSETAEVFGGTMASLDTLDAIAEHVASCRRCPLYSTALNPVPGEGNPTADLMCVGEAPGANEDQTGRPFIGAAGQLLTKILEAIKLPRDQVYICNVLKHRPPGNRNPLPEEVTACSPYLIRQIELVKPKVILALGTFAAQTLLETQLSLGKLRGQIHRYHGVPLIVTYHPAALLRNPNWKRPTWEDVQLARRILDSASPGA
jgi:DNA polymerase